MQERNVATQKNIDTLSCPVLIGFRKGSSVLTQRQTSASIQYHEKPGDFPQKIEL